MNSCRRFPIAALLSLCSLRAASVDGDLLGRAPCTFPAYGKVTGVEPYASKGEYEEAVADRKFACEKLQYSSSGLPVVAFLYRPSNAGDRQLPVVVFNRGSWVVHDQLPLLVAIFHRLAEAGFVVLAPMYRGSEGAPGRDEMGGAELADLFNILPLARSLSFADTRNVFLYGESRGGVMTLLALRDGFPARAAATFGAFTDLGAYLDHDARAHKAVTQIWPDYDQQKERILATRSAIRWPDKINAPLLLMHGGADRQVDPRQSFDLTSRLEELGKVYRLSIFGGDSHVIAGHRVERDQQAILWFRKHLQ